MLRIVVRCMAGNTCPDGLQAARLWGCGGSTLWPCLLLILSLGIASCASRPHIGITEISFTARDNQAALTTDLSTIPKEEHVTLRAPHGTDLSSLTPQISFAGAALTPPSGTPQDFRQPVIYTVADQTAERNFTIQVVADSQADLFPVAGDGVPGEVLQPAQDIPGGGKIRISLPPDFQDSGKKYPLHLHFHGAGGDLYGTDRKFPFHFVAGTPGRQFILAAWESGDFNLAAILDHLTRHYPVDTEHIWLSGHSTGAYTVLNDPCYLPPDGPSIEGIIVMSSPFLTGCPAGKHLFIISGSFDFVPFFSYQSSANLYRYSKELLMCRQEALLTTNFDNYPSRVRRHAAFDCNDAKEIHLYTMIGEAHNPQLSRNFANNIMSEVFRVSGLDKNDGAKTPSPAGKYGLLRLTHQGVEPAEILRREDAH